MKIIGIIPARYQSSRFPGKPLALINGKPMIQRTWEQASKALETVVVATDDERIRRAVESFGGIAVMTSAAHRSGTDRCAEAETKYSGSAGINFDVVINIQGDESYIEPEQIKLLAGCFKDNDVQIATLIKKIGVAGEIFNPNHPKVIFDKNGFAIYFSRSPIPYVMGKSEEEWIDSFNFFGHIGMYAYRTSILHRIVSLKPSMLETSESLEQNRWLENCYKIRVIETDINTIAIDTPADLDKITNR
jgi:3-deoxy-manno-octulosonate cytidylyltransferase (CMP-KDO synthetase)